MQAVGGFSSFGRRTRAGTLGLHLTLLIEEFGIGLAHLLLRGVVVVGRSSLSIPRQHDLLRVVFLALPVRSLLSSTILTALVSNVFRAKRLVPRARR